MRACGTIEVSERALAHLRALASRGVREEVGLVLGVGCQARVLFPARNTSESPAEFIADPIDIVAAHNLAESLTVDVMAIYHTHPFGGAAPSEKDVQGMGHWPIPWLIASPHSVRAWMARKGSVEELPLVVVP